MLEQKQIAGRDIQQTLRNRTFSPKAKAYVLQLQPLSHRAAQSQWSLTAFLLISLSLLCVSVGWQIH